MPWYKTLAMYATKTHGPSTQSVMLEETKHGDSNQQRASLEKEANDRVTKDLQELQNDPDCKLLSLVVEKVVIVRVTNIVRSAYDPMSTAQTLKLTGLLEWLISLYPTLTGESKQVRELLEVVREKLKHSIDTDVYIPVGYPKHFLENPLSGHSAFLQRQFWGAFKLYRNVLAWQGILADALIAEMALNSILNRYMVIGLGVMVSCNEHEQVMNKCRHIVGALPKSWILKDSGLNEQKQVNAQIYKIGLERFAKFLLNTFGRAQNTGSAAKIVPQSCVKDSVKLLRIIGAVEDSETLERNIFGAVT